MDDDASSLKEVLGDDLFEFELGTGAAYTLSPVLVPVPVRLV